MSIFDIKINEYEQRLISKKEDKEQYGEINTPFSLIDTILDLFPDKVFEDPHLKWLDPGTGHGYFMMALYKRLYYGIIEKIPNPQARSKHIIENMLYMCEINEIHKSHLESLFGDKANIIYGDFLEYNQDFQFDCIIGNPPYNVNGAIKVPTNKLYSKKNDGKTIWTLFVKKSISILKPNGLLSMIIPSIWLKPDRAKMHDYMLSYQLHKIHCLTNTQTNQIFKKQAQTPTCFFLLEKKQRNGPISLYDKILNSYQIFNNSMNLSNEMHIPLCGVTVINKLSPFVLKYGKIPVIKTNMPLKNTSLTTSQDEIYKYPNISTTVLAKTRPQIVINYSNKPLVFNDVPKLVLAHKMYGLPYHDKTGKYGISNRDNYIIKNYSESELEVIRQFLSTKFALYVFETTRYRMKYLEKYAFDSIPDPTKLPNFPTQINDCSISEYFKFTALENDAIEKIHKKTFTEF